MRWRTAAGSTRGWGRGGAQAGWWSVFAATILACGPGEVPVEDRAALTEVPQRLLIEGAWFEAKLVGPGTAIVEVAEGRLPGGLELTEDGLLRGIPSEAGEIARFLVASRSAHGELLETRGFVFAVGVDPQTTTDSLLPTVDRVDDVLALQASWGRPVAGAFVWDPRLRLAWPLRPGIGLEGKALAAAAGTVELHVGGPALRVRHEIEESMRGGEFGAVAQLVWNAQAEADLDLVMVAADGTMELGPEAPVLAFGGAVAARHLWDESGRPGAEGVVVARDAPAGSYALYALRRGGPAVSIEAWLSVRDSDGAALVDAPFPLLLSETALGTVAEERAAGRQSWRHLGDLRVEADGNVRYEQPLRRSSSSSFAARED